MKQENRLKPWTEIEDRQKNTVLPDTLRNEKYVFAFLWRGSPNITLVQRLGSALLALLLWSTSGAFLRFCFIEQAPMLFRAFVFLLALPWAVIGYRLTKNALSGLSKHSNN